MTVSSDADGAVTPKDGNAIVAACVELAYAFCRYSDRNEVERYSALFADDGEFHRPGLDVVGREAIAQALAQRPATVAMRHVCANPMVEIVDAGHATGTGSQVVYRHDRTTGVTEPAILVDYDDRYVRTADGWRIASRTVSLSF